MFLKKVLSHNYWAILYFNFKMLPFRQAIRLPFDFSHKIRFENLSGTIVLNSSNICRGMIKVGARGSDMFSHNSTIIDIRGKVLFNGFVELGCGSLLCVKDRARISFGNSVRIGAMTKIFCEEEIFFGDEIGFSWECQIFDTDFHYMQSIVNNTLSRKTASIEIGSYTWFGNRVNVMKGTIIPAYTTVASNSLCNKDYRFVPKYSLLAGSPAKVVKQGIRRMFERIDL
ncbi:MAG: hypothetical protein LBN29_12170 [Mediterranea sp.]|jgi:acetyltransferase-like isoleucine patch superfamily enzyme|nr:hypothetical protein [Mediterranea sp.]